MRLPDPYRPESEVVARCIASMTGRLDWLAAVSHARPWVNAVRDNPPPFWAMESLLREYPISSAEGLALMRLAEALLRVPDTETAIALTADQLGRADFAGPQDGAAHGMLAGLSASAIALSKKFLPADGDEPGLVKRLGSRTVLAATLRAVQLLGRQFVLGQDIDSALHEADAARRTQPGLRYSYDMLGEGARTAEDAGRCFDSYRHAIERIAAWPGGSNPAGPQDRDGISIKLSALHPRYDHTQHERVMRELVPRVWQLCEMAARADINLTIDAEEVDRLELSLDVFEALLARIAQHHPQWRGFGLAMQAYQTRALELIEHVASLARRYGLRLMCRLVKGAYWDTEIKRAQEMGLAHYPVFTHKHHTDASYLACAQAMLAAGDVLYAQFATHNAGTIAAILQMASGAGQSAYGQAFELQRLHGMGEGIYREVMKLPHVTCRVYAPVGQHRDLLAYLVRRLLENGANSSFVHRLADPEMPVDELLASPLHAEPQPGLPLPADLFGPEGVARRNSAGLDFSVGTDTQRLESALADAQVPVVPAADASSVAAAISRSVHAFPSWSCTPVQLRAQVLRRAGDMLQAQMPEFCALLVKEAFKTWGDAVAEVREAIDFLRYYADEAQRIMAPVALPGPTGERNELRLTARGAWVCISPWNFPLAIFTGQVAASLATGNVVLAKPAEQTPGVAVKAAGLLHLAGVPADALQLLNGAGETVGAALVADPRIAGVVFTGSTQVAKAIQRALADKDGPIIPLIAETGGINAMVVDSTALPEQVVDAVVQSAFRSAGQRCSALRLLCVHESVADAVIAMVAGAARELRAGDPSDIATDVGPVIDREAFDGIHQQIGRLRAGALTVLAPDTPLPDVPNLMAPHAFEIARIADLRQEIFGPVLHIVRWRGDPQTVIDGINELGFGLTLGLQTRIDGRAQALAARAHVGNVYVNRNIIGAVVGVQPFGGEGLSGTGPKAGGPYYLYRFCAERTLTVNTAAAGGNAALLA